MVSQGSLPVDAGVSIDSRPVFDAALLLEDQGYHLVELFQEGLSAALVNLDLSYHVDHFRSPVDL